eukprot:350435-Chlamydomonas_euryale.AAC.8
MHGHAPGCLGHAGLGHKRAGHAHMQARNHNRKALRSTEASKTAGVAWAAPHHLLLRWRPTWARMATSQRSSRRRPTLTVPADRLLPQQVHACALGALPQQLHACAPGALPQQVHACALGALPQQVHACALDALPQQVYACALDALPQQVHACALGALPQKVHACALGALQFVPAGGQGWMHALLNDVLVCESPVLHHRLPLVRNTTPRVTERSDPWSVVGE